MVGDLDELNLINNVDDPVGIGLNQQADDHPPILPRSGRTVRLTDKGREYRQSLGLANLSELDVDEPQSYKEAMQSPFSEEWLEAFRVEFCAQQAINSIKVVPKSEVPPGANIIPHKWVGKYKPGYGSVPARFKGRLTAVGSRQRPGIDYEETFAPVPRLDSFRMFMSIVASEDLELIQLDISHRRP